MKLSLRHVVRWLRANLRHLGCNLDSLGIDEGTDTVVAAMRCGFPRACTLKEFYAGLYKQEKTEQSRFPLKSRTGGLMRNTKGKKVFGDNIQTAEQFIMLANMGLAVDKREKK